jgi:uncharacterized protein (TIGR02145 family)
MHHTTTTMRNRLLFSALLLLAANGCEKREFIELVEMKTGAADEVLATSARLGGAVVDAGPGIEDYGICLSEQANPTVNDARHSLGSASAPGNFSLVADQLKPGTQYYFRAYAFSKGRSVYGDAAGFRTMSGVPRINTLEPWGHSPNAIMAGGRIEDDGGAPITARGLCWNASGNPEAVKDATLTDGASGTGSFALKVEGLQQDKTYHIRAWAANAVNTWYGETRSFILKKPEVITLEAGEITPTSARLQGTANAHGASAAVAFEWGETIAYGNTVSATPDSITGSMATSVSAVLTGLIPGVTYHFRIKGTNSVGSTTGENKNFIYTGIAFNPDLSYGSVTDIDGNSYRTIRIGDQVWMAENLRVTKYRNGTEIPYVTDMFEWSVLTSAAYCWPHHDETAMAATYGAFYSWYAVADPKGLCPQGWHVPSDGEWALLTDFLGGAGAAGGKMKETGISHWWGPNAWATNSSGFTGLPAGGRYHFDGHFRHMRRRR